MSLLAGAFDVTASAVANLPLYHGYEPTSGTTGFSGPGTWIIFGLILMPVYVMTISWFVGNPSDEKTGLLGVVYLVGITANMWVGMLVLTVLIGLIFYGGAPSPLG
ncbi:hypothetical protein C479_02911 [Halovivax asiaticus JCM 14624]|uniref:Uncharacterized protein n=1 Tax=Halovivax asiaticus JCM 14624 TaxID=1227490 RepID=M0BRY2_9EURY|nr:hypothetical protein [Halovivax asiaticus]ELZ13761.1 hypothetical protein C479_02911 [Halovivax asiaticus JCM 14624]